MSLHNSTSYPSTYAERFNEKCLCCNESVGRDDAQEIYNQLCNNEKNCMWCGEDFNLTDDQIENILNGDDENIEKIAKELNFKSKFTETLPLKKEKIKYENEKRDIILEKYGIDIDKEYFDPGFVDMFGNPRDRIADGIPYERVSYNDLAYRMLEYVKRKPGCNTTELKKQSLHSFTSKRKIIYQSPIARMMASGLLECTSKFAGLYTVRNKNMISKYFGQIPRFKRAFTITKKGIGVLEEFDKGKKSVLL